MSILTGVVTSSCFTVSGVFSKSFGTSGTDSGLIGFSSTGGIGFSGVDGSGVDTFGGSTTFSSFDSTYAIKLYFRCASYLCQQL